MHLLQSNWLIKEFTLWIYCVFPAAHVLPVFSPHPSRHCLNATELSVTFTRYMWSGPRLCSGVSSLITMSSLVWSCVTKAPFTGAASLLSSISLKFHCSGWEVPQASRHMWSQWRNVASLSCFMNTYCTVTMTAKVFWLKHQGLTSCKITLTQNVRGIHSVYFAALERHLWKKIYPMKKTIRNETAQFRWLCLCCLTAACLFDQQKRPDNWQTHHICR